MILEQQNRISNKYDIPSESENSLGVLLFQAYMILAEYPQNEKIMIE